MWKSGFNLEHRFLNRARFGEPAFQALVEAPHELSGRSVVNSPETDYKGRSASVKKSACESQQFITFPNRVHSCFAGAQRRYLGAELQIKNVEEKHPAIAHEKR